MFPRLTPILVATVVLLHPPSPASAQTSQQKCPVPVAAPAPRGVPDQALLTSHRFATGAGVKVAVIDTGVAAHPRLGQVVPGADLILDKGKEGSLEDCDGHGTVVAGIIAARPDPSFQDAMVGIAPDAEIISIRQSSSVLRSPTAPEESAGTIATLAEAIHRALDLSAHVINVSLASCVPKHLASSLDTSVLDRALERAEEHGAVVVAAAGNIGPACPEDSVSFPAASPAVLAVSASDGSHNLADYSLAVDKPVLSAPGTVPVGLSPSGSGAASGMNTQQGARPFSGTSFAAPVVAGMVAQLKQRYPHDSPAALRERIYHAASPGTGEVPVGAALMQLSGAEVEQRAHVAAPPYESTRLQLRSVKLLLLSAGAVSVLLCVVALVRVRFARAERSRERVLDLPEAGRG